MQDSLWNRSRGPSLRRTEPLAQLILALRNQFQIRDFIETGTWYGDTAAWASAHFERVVTIEKSEAIYHEAQMRHGHLPSVRFILGDSREALRRIVPELVHSALFWLDSHWSGGPTSGEDDECPLLGELRVINESPRSHFLLIDDARLFAAPPPRPHRIEQWPSIDQVVESLRAQVGRYVVVIEDVIICVPIHARSFLAGYCQDLATRASELRKRRTSVAMIMQGMGLVKQGLKELGQEWSGYLRALRPKS